MKSFKTFISEEVDLAANVRSGNVDIDDPAVRDSINTFLTGVTAKCFVTPYIAYERVSKVLANFHVHLPRTTFLENDSGMVVLPVSQFGGKVGMRNDGTVVTKDPQPYHVYFEYRRSEKGLFDVFCEILDEAELDDIMDDLHDEMDDYSDSDDDAGSQVFSATDSRDDKFDHGKKMYEETGKIKKKVNDFLEKLLGPIGSTHGLPGNDPNALVPLNPSIEDHRRLHKIQEETARKRALELSAKQRERYARRKGEPPPVLDPEQGGSAKFPATQKEKDKIKKILAQQRLRRRESKETRREMLLRKKSEIVARTTPVPNLMAAQPTQTPSLAKQPASKASDRGSDFLRGYKMSVDRYSTTGDPVHLERAQKAALGHYGFVVSKISDHPGHPDYEAAKSAAEEMLKSHMDALENVKGHVERHLPKPPEPQPIPTPEKKGLVSKFKKMFKEEALQEARKILESNNNK